MAKANDFTLITGDEALRTIVSILERYDVGRLGLFGTEYPYVIPMNHAYEDGKLIMHGSYAGKKIDFMRANPKVCYEVDGSKDGKDSGQRSCHLEYESVLCYGTLREVTDCEEKARMLSLLNSRFDKPAITHGDVVRCNAFVMHIDEMTGRTGRFRPTGERPLYVYHFQR